MVKKISKTHQRVQAAARHRAAGTETDLLKSFDESWDNLTQLKDSLGEAVMGVSMQVVGMTQNPDLRALLGDKTAEFDKLVQTFMSDTKEFASRVEGLRTQHEHLSGRITSMSDYQLFSKLSLEYHNAQSELQALTAPTISELVLITNECICNAREAQALTDPQVVSDVTVKEI